VTTASGTDPLGWRLMAAWRPGGQHRALIGLAPVGGNGVGRDRDPDGALRDRPGWLAARRDRFNCGCSKLGSVKW